MKTIEKTEYITSSRSYDIYSDGMILFNYDGLYFSVYENITNFVNDVHGESRLKCYANEYAAENFIQNYTINEPYYTPFDSQVNEEGETEEYLSV